MLVTTAQNVIGKNHLHLLEWCTACTEAHDQETRVEGAA